MKKFFKDNTNMKINEINLNDLSNPEGRFALGNLLGCGVFGKVYSATDGESDNRKVAIKIQKLNEDTSKYLEEEYKILKNFSSHLNVPDFYDAYKRHNEIWYVIELCEGGSVLDLVNGLLMKNRHMTEEHVAYILKETVKALIYLHQNKIIHRDVKASNILLTKDGEVKLCDFGVSKSLGDVFDKTGTSLGAPYWMAPEVVTSKSGDEERAYDNRADVWALGITAIELCDGKPPYQDMHPTRALFQIVRNPPPTFAIPSNCSNTYNDFVNECLIKNPEHRPYMEEVIEHPFLIDVPENNYHLSLEIKSVLNDLNDIEVENLRPPELMVNGTRLKKGVEGKMEKMYVEDLAALGKINENIILDQLEARMKKGEHYTFIGDILLYLNPNEKQNIYGSSFHQKYKCKSRSDNAPHIYAVADSAYQDALHHITAQKIVLSGETGSGKTINYLYLIDHLLFLGENYNINIQRIKNAVKLIHSLTHASTRFNKYSTRCMIKTNISYGSTGKVTGASFNVHLLEKWRISSIDMNQGNFHFLYYFYDGLNAKNELQNYSLNNQRQYRYLRIKEDDIIGSPRNNIEENIAKFEKLEKTLREYEFSEEQITSIYNVVAAILIIGDVRFQQSEQENAEIENEDCVKLVAKLLNIEDKKLSWAFKNYCLIHKGAAVRRRNTCDEARDARDVLANNLYSRIVDYIVSFINYKLSIGKAIFGEKYSINIWDYAGFECFKKNHLPQLFVNSLNEQLQYHYLQRIFTWESMELDEEDIVYSPIHYYDNRITLDQLMTKTEGILSFIDEASKMGHGGKYILDALVNQEKQHIVGSGGSEFSVAHYTGKVSYDAKEMPDRNRDYQPPEITETLRLSSNTIIKLLFTNKLNKFGNLIINFEENTTSTKQLYKFQNSNNKMDSSQQYSQIKKMRTASAIFKSLSLDLLKELSVGAGSGGTHFVRCIRCDLENRPGNFNPEITKHQLRALAVVETAKARQQGFPHRIVFSEFLRRYKFLAFDFNENVDITKENCRLLLIRLGMEGWAIGKTKVFLKYYNEEYLSRLYETQIKKIIKIQSILRKFLAKCQLSHENKDKEKVVIHEIKRRQSTMTEDEAASIIQQAYRQSTKKGHIGDPLSQKYEQLDEDTIEFIYPYAKKWKSKSIFQVLLHYRCVTYQDLFDLSQQVHFFNQKAFYNLQKMSEPVDLNDIDSSAKMSSWLGEIKPALLKLPFRLDEIPFYDTTQMCDSLTNVGASIDKDEAWDSPYRYRELISSKYEDTHPKKIVEKRKKLLSDIINTPYNRDPEQPISILPPIEDGEEETSTPKKLKKNNENLAVRESQYCTSKFEDKIKKEETFMNLNTKPANKDFDYIKPASVTKSVKPSKPDPISELRDIARRASLTLSEDDPPFNFRGMLRKTNFHRDSIKKNEESATQPFKRHQLKTVTIVDKNQKNLIMNGHDNEKPIKGVKIEAEVAPGVFIQGTEVEL